MTTKRETTETAETAEPKGAKSPVDPDRLAGYPKSAKTYEGEDGRQVQGIAVGPEFDDSFPKYEFDENQ